MARIEGSVEERRVEIPTGASTGERSPPSSQTPSEMASKVVPFVVMITGGGGILSPPATPAIPYYMVFSKVHVIVSFISLTLGLLLLLLSLGISLPLAISDRVARNLTWAALAAVYVGLAICVMASPSVLSSS